MSEIPDTWPPEDSEHVSTVVPMFPLPGVFLFPRQLMPLHIFEPRYRQMIEDCLDGPGRIVLATLTESSAESQALAGVGDPPVFPIAGLGEIARHERLEDGRFLIWLFGLTRVQVYEEPTDTPYRKVRYEALEETTSVDSGNEELREQLSTAILARTPKFLNLPDDIPIALLADLLLQRLKLPPASMELLFAEMNTKRRARRALAEHERTPIITTDEDDDLESFEGDPDFDLDPDFDED